MDFLGLPNEILEAVLRFLPPVSLLSCSKAAPQFSLLIQGEVFLDRYCQRLFQADWIKWDMIRKVRGSFPLVVDMWYLNAVNICHPKLMFKSQEPLHSIGLFIYTLNIWFLYNREHKVTNANQCVECHGTDYLKSKFPSRTLLQLVMKLALTVPECIIASLFDNQFFSCFRGEADNFREVGEQNRRNFNCHSHLEIAPSRMSALLTVGEDFWIGCSGHLNGSEAFYNSKVSECKLSLAAPLDETRRALKETFGHFVDIYEQYRVVHSIAWRCYLIGNLSTLSEDSQKPVFKDLHFLLEHMARKVKKNISPLQLKPQTSQRLKQYLDGLLWAEPLPGVIDSVKESKTLFVSIMRCLRRALNKVFYSECTRYMEDKACVEYLMHARKSRKGVPRLIPILKFYKVSIHKLPTKFWPPHLLQHAVMAVPMVSRLVQLDIVLWTKGLHGQPVSNKIRQFLLDQTASCGLRIDTSPRTPLCGLVKYN